MFFKIISDKIITHILSGTIDVYILLNKEINFVSLKI